MYEKICPECGTKFLAQRVQKIYCCDECKAMGNQKNVNAANKKFRKKQRRQSVKGLSMAKINELARKRGMTYGQYVAKYGL